MRCNLDGTNCMNLRNSSLISNPNGLSYHDNKLYVTDSNFNHHISHPSVAVYDVISGDWHEIGAQVCLCMFLIINREALGKQEDNALGSVPPSVRLSVCDLLLELFDLSS